MRTVSGRGIRSIAGTAVAAAIAVTVTACGEGEDEPFTATDRPTASVKSLQSGFDRDDPEAICEVMTRTAMREAGNIGHGDPTTCVRDVDKVLSMIRDNGGWDSSTKPSVVEVEQQGGEAMAMLALDNGFRGQAPFVRRDGKWKLDGFFGIAEKRLQRVQARAPSQPFPVAGAGTAVEVLDGSGVPCPALSDKRYPEVSGGCRIDVSRPRVPVRMLTPFGDFRFGFCSVDYRVRVDSEGRTWTSDWVVEGSKETGCSDINPCATPKFVYQPWKGRIRPDGKGGFIHHMDMCLRTCVGTFSGNFAVRLVRAGKGWRVEPSNVGAPGFRLDAPLEVYGSNLRVRATAPQPIAGQSFPRAETSIVPFISG